jgi:hypothetical protein
LFHLADDLLEQSLAPSRLLQELPEGDRLDLKGPALIEVRK